MNVSVDFGLGEVVKWAREISTSLSESRASSNARKRRQWAENMIIREIIRSRPGETEIFSPSRSGVSPELISGAGADVSTITNFASVSFNSEVVLRQRMSRICSKIGHWSLVESGIRDYISGKFRWNSVLECITGEMYGPRFEVLEDEVANQTEVARQYFQEVEGILVCEGREKLRELLEPSMLMINMDDNEAGEPCQISPNTDSISGGVVVRGVLWLFLSGPTAGNYVLTNGKRARCITAPNSPVDTELVRRLCERDAEAYESSDYFKKEYCKMILEITRDWKHTNAAVHAGLMLIALTQGDGDVEKVDKELKGKIHAIYEDLTIAKKLLLMYLSAAGHPKSIIPSIKQIKDVTINGSENAGYVTKISAVLPDAAIVSDGANVWSEMLEPDYEKAEEDIIRYSEREFSWRHRGGTKKYKKEMDLEAIRYKAIMEPGAKIESTSGIDTELRKAGTNMFSSENSVLIYIPSSEGALYLSRRLSLDKVGPSKKQKFTNVCMMPYTVPAVLMQALDIDEDQRVVDKVFSSLNRGGHLFDLHNIISTDIQKKMNSVCETGYLRVSSLVRGSIFTSLDSRERAWVHREIVDTLIDMGSYNVKETIGKSCYYDVVKELFQTPRGKMKVDLDIGTPLEGLLIHDKMGNLHLEPAGDDGRRAVLCGSDRQAMSKLKTGTRIVHLQAMPVEGKLEVVGHIIPKNVLEARG